MAEDYTVSKLEELLVPDPNALYYLLLIMKRYIVINELEIPNSLENLMGYCVQIAHQHPIQKSDFFSSYFDCVGKLEKLNRDGYVPPWGDVGERIQFFVKFRNLSAKFNLDYVPPQPSTLSLDIRTIVAEIGSTLYAPLPSTKIIEEIEGFLNWDAGEGITLGYMTFAKRNLRMWENGYLNDGTYVIFHNFLNHTNVLTGHRLKDVNGKYTKHFAIDNSRGYWPGSRDLASSHLQHSLHPNYYHHVGEILVTYALHEYAIVGHRTSRRPKKGFLASLRKETEEFSEPEHELRPVPAGSLLEKTNYPNDPLWDVTYTGQIIHDFQPERPAAIRLAMYLPETIYSSFIEQVNRDPNFLQRVYKAIYPGWSDKSLGNKNFLRNGKILMVTEDINTESQYIRSLVRM